MSLPPARCPEEAPACRLSPTRWPKTRRRTPEASPADKKLPSAPYNSPGAPRPYFYIFWLPASPQEGRRDRTAEETIKEKFGALYNAFKFGAPPHAGMAPGVDRMIMLLTDEENIREIIAFPMNSNAQDVMLGSPNEVTEQQLREVHIKIRG